MRVPNSNFVLDLKYELLLYVESYIAAIFCILPRFKLLCCKKLDTDSQELISDPEDK